MKFKYYLVTNDFDKSLKFYENLFEARIEKNNKRHAKMHFFDKIQFLLYSSENAQTKKDGYLIIRFDKSEKDIYNRIANRAKEMNLKINIDNKSYRWGTTITEFVDPFGYTWDIEIDS